METRGISVLAQYSSRGLEKNPRRASLFEPRARRSLMDEFQGQGLASLFDVGCSLSYPLLYCLLLLVSISRGESPCLRYSPVTTNGGPGLPKPAQKLHIPTRGNFPK